MDKQRLILFADSSAFAPWPQILLFVLVAGAGAGTCSMLPDPGQAPPSRGGLEAALGHWARGAGVRGRP